MAAITASRNTKKFGDRPVPDLLQVPVAAATRLFQGGMVGVHGPGHAGAGNLTKMVAPSPAGGLICLGRMDKEVDNTSGAAGAKVAEVHQGVFGWDNAAAGDAVSNAHIGLPCYATDDHTVASQDSGGTRPFAGIVVWVDTAANVVYAEQRASLRNPNAQILSFAVTLAAIAAGQTVAAFAPGFTGHISRLEFIVAAPATTAAKAATITPRITPSGGAAAAVTGGVLALTSANCTPNGAKVAGTTVTAGNFFGPQDSIDLTASAVTAFVEGTGTLLLYLG